jgi:glutamine amidotransferase
VIALIDYGAGNLTSVKKALTSLGADFVVPSSPAECERASGLIVPGVGHFSATTALDTPWRDAIGSAVAAGTPLLGICVGMQWLFEGSDEAPALAGLGLIGGRCARLTAARPLKVPHVGWNALRRTRESAILTGVEPDAYVYFTHTYAAPVTPDCVATTEHGGAFAAVVQRGHVAGVQFHPEKSGAAGLRLLANFVAMTRS